MSSKPWHMYVHFHIVDINHNHICNHIFAGFIGYDSDNDTAGPNEERPTAEEEPTAHRAIINGRP